MTKTRNLHPSLQEEDGDSRSREYAALVRAAAAGQRGAIERLLVRAQEVAFRFSFLVCGHTEDAEDVMQDALLRTYRHVERIKRPEAFRTWLYTTVRNACLMKRRRRVGEPKHHLSIEAGTLAPDGEHTPIDVSDHGQMPDEAVMNSWLGSRLRSALGSLPPGLRMVVFLREMEGLSTREVAQVMRISEANVKTRLHRARTLLRAQLEGV